MCGLTEIERQEFHYPNIIVEPNINNYSKTNEEYKKYQLENNLSDDDFIDSWKTPEHFKMFKEAMNNYHIQMGRERRLDND